MIPVVLIDATNYVYKFITTKTTSIQILNEFQYRFVMQKFWFSVPPLLTRFRSSNVILCRLCTV